MQQITSSLSGSASEPAPKDLPDPAQAPGFVIALSGGLDSAVLCAMLCAQYTPKAVHPVFFLYGSKHNTWEQRAAKAVAAHFGLTLANLDLRPCFADVRSALLAHDKRDIPLAVYDEHSMAQTVVPGRNLLFVASLASLAQSKNAPYVALATHSGDHHLYPDCRPEFNEALNHCIRLGSDGAVRLVTPFSAMSKADIVRLGLSLAAPLHLTRSCYLGQEKACGRCGTCRERLDAFAQCGKPDPVPYSI